MLLHSQFFGQKKLFHITNPQELVKDCFQVILELDYFNIKPTCIPIVN